MDRTKAVRFALSLFATLVIPALAEVLLAAEGYETAGTIAWALLFSTGVVWLWHRWVRPIDVTGPPVEDA